MKEETEIILGGYTFHLFETLYGWLGYVSSQSWKVDSSGVEADTKEELLGKLMLEKVINH